MPHNTTACAPRARVQGPAWCCAVGPVHQRRSARPAAAICQGTQQGRQRQWHGRRHSQQQQTASACCQRAQVRPGCTATEQPQWTAAQQHCCASTALLHINSTAAPALPAAAVPVLLLRRVRAGGQLATRSECSQPASARSLPLIAARVLLQQLMCAAHPLAAWTLTAFPHWRPACSSSCSGSRRVTATTTRAATQTCCLMRQQSSSRQQLATLPLSSCQSRWGAGECSQRQRPASWWATARRIAAGDAQVPARLLTSSSLGRGGGSGRCAAGPAADALLLAPGGGGSRPTSANKRFLHKYGLSGRGLFAQ